MTAALALFFTFSCSSDSAGPPLEYQVWCDTATGLCWQTPQKDAFDPHDTGVVPSEAFAYCRSLEIGGTRGWRLPTIDELRSLVAGSPETETGGGCGVTSGASTDQGKTPACLGGLPHQGPGQGGCYWKQGLTGTCDKPDPAVVGHPLETWALNPAADEPEHWVAYATFDTGAVGFNHACSLGEVRCVRSPPGEPPPECRIRGVPCEEFLPSKTHCDQDLLDQADSLLLNVRLPEAPLRAPYQLLAFLYRSHEGWFPPLAPPDGGTDFNQMISPQFGQDLTLILRVPGTTYYREELLTGDFQLYVHVQLEDKFPPVPVDGDYVWGEGRPHISFPFDGSEHRASERAMEITLEPVGCPAAAPVRCPDGSCVSDPALCVATECPSVPDDARVLTCRYASLFDPENCADFPPDQGWDAAGVDAFCRAQPGADESTVVVTLGNSCLVEKGGFSTATRCALREAGRPWWAYGPPQFVCTFLLGGAHQEGPFCSAYEWAGGRHP